MRPCYRPSGELNGAAFAMWTLLTVLVSAILGLIALALYLTGFYIVIVVPVIAGAVIGGMNYLAVRRGHCRNEFAAAIAGMVAAAIFFGVCFGARSFFAPVEETLSAIPGWRWAFLAIETLLVFGLSVLIGAAPTRFPYGEEQQCWLAVKHAFCRGVPAKQLLERMRWGPAVSLFAELKTTEKPEPGDLYLMLYCCDRVQRPDRPAQMYLRVVEEVEEPKGDEVAPRRSVNARKAPALLVYPEEYELVLKLFSLLENAETSKP